VSFDNRDLRRGMDVFDADGVYLGTVAWVRRSGKPAAAGHVARNTGEPVGGAFSGESLGPMPTAGLGNAGPGCQTASSAYASTARPERADHRPRPTELIVVSLPVLLSHATLRPRIRRVPVSLVQAVSLERIILSVPASGLP
jgi:hypothetical protein